MCSSDLMGMGWLCLMTGCLFFAPTALAMQGTYLARSIRHVKLGMGLLWGLHAFRMMDQYLLWQSFLSPDEGMGVWWQTLAGQTMAWQMLCVSLAWVWSLRWKPVGNLRHGLMLVALSMTMGGYAMAGHGAWASETSWQSAAAVVHVMLAQAWLAGVLGLLWLFWQKTPSVGEAQQRLSNFSFLALPGMLVLLMSGGLISLWSVGSWPALLVTGYGEILILKLCLVAVSLRCAWSLRRCCHPRRVKRWLPGNGCNGNPWARWACCSWHAPWLPPCLLPTRPWIGHGHFDGHLSWLGVKTPLTRSRGA